MGPTFTAGDEMVAALMPRRFWLEGHARRDSLFEQSIGANETDGASQQEAKQTHASVDREINDAGAVHSYARPRGRPQKCEGHERGGDLNNSQPQQIPSASRVRFVPDPLVGVSGSEPHTVNAIGRNAPQYERAGGGDHNEGAAKKHDRKEEHDCVPTIN